MTAAYMRQTAKRGYVLRKLRQKFSATEMWCEHWNVKINEDKTKATTVLTDLGPLRLILH
jgi:hypothetical protein